MGTNSLIGYRFKDEEKVTAIWCRFDGYRSGNGASLLEFYKTFKDVRKLMKVGDISSIDYYTGKATPDREGIITLPKTFENAKALEEATYGSYYYIFVYDREKKNGKWYWKYCDYKDEKFEYARLTKKECKRKKS